MLAHSLFPGWLHFVPEGVLQMERYGLRQRDKSDTRHQEFQKLSIERKIKPEIRRDRGVIHHRCALNTEPGLPF